MADPSPLLAELVELLTCGDLDLHEQNQVAMVVAAAPENPELDWAESASQAMSFELYSCLADHCACGDGIDEVHEQLQAMFNEPLSALPPAFTGPLSRPEYFDWLAVELATRAVDRGGYGVVMLDDQAGDTMYLFVVYRAGIARLLELASALGLRFRAPHGV